MIDLAGVHPSSVRRVVVLRAGALGDFVLTLPALAALRRHYPRAQIDLIASQSAGALAVASGYVDRLFALDELWVTSLFGDVVGDEARRWLDGVDLAVAWLTNNAAVAARLHEAGVRLVHAAASFPSNDDKVHVADHLLETLRPLGIPFEPARPIIRLRDGDRERGARILGEVGIDPRRSFAVIHPGSGSRFKNWPAEQFAALVVHLTRRVEGGALLLAGPADDEALELVLAAVEIWGWHEPIRVLRPTTTLELAAAVSHAAVFVGNDSGATHVAAAVGVPTVAIFGPTDPRRWAPRGRIVRLVRHPVECSPCTRSEMQTCSHRSCLTRLGLAPTMAAIEEALTAAREEGRQTAIVTPD